MVFAALVGSALLAAAPERETLAPPDLAAYESAQAGVGRDPDAHVKLALWCEAHGLQAERVKHLALAVMADPKNALARGLLGLVEYRGRWQRPEAVGAQAAADARLAEYRDRRAGTVDTADAQWDLALWCEQNGLKAEAAAHFAAVVRLDPKREAARKHLGYKRQGHRWLTDAQLAEERAEAEQQKQADHYWKPLLEKWRDRLGSKVQAKRNEADAALAAITDPRAVPMVWSVFATGSPERQAVAVRIFGQIDAAGASRALAMLAVSGRSAEVRRTATETLRHRDVREFADVLIALVRDPIQYTIRPVGGPGSPGELRVEGKTANIARRYSPPAANIPMLPGDRIVYDASGLPVLDRPLSGPRHLGMFPLAWVTSNLSDQPLFGSMMSTSIGRPFGKFTRFDLIDRVDAHIPIGRIQIEAEKSAVVAQQQLANDVEPLKRYNEAIKPCNDRVLAILAEISGQDLGPDREAWVRWWTDQIGYTILPQKASEKPTIVEDVPLDYQPQPVPVAVVDQIVGYRRMSCFGAGTPVHTLSGVRPIESLAVGDRVLTQDLRSGGLGYRPVLVVHRNPPSKTFRIALGDETIVSSYFHRFWKAGHGWVMARDLTSGDIVRTLGGLVRVGAIDEGSVQPVFNLDVAEDADFFVGRQGALVHDNTLPDLRLPPFDAPPSLAAAP